MNIIQKAVNQLFPVKNLDPLPEGAVLFQVGSKVRLAGGEKLGLYGEITAIDDEDIEITRYDTNGNVADVFLLAVKDKEYLQPN